MPEFSALAGFEPASFPEEAKPDGLGGATMQLPRQLQFRRGFNPRIGLTIERLFC
jgi:hypothetical protein